MTKAGPSRLFRMFSRNKAKYEEQVEEEIKSMVTEGHEQGVILEDEAEMINNIFEFGEKEAKDVMSPRQKIEGMDAALSLEEAMNLMLEHGFSRYPLYEEDLDNIIGVLHLKDAMRYYMRDKDAVLKEIAREPFFVHPTQNIQKLLKDMQTKKIHMAIVVDEYGQTEGIVAMEDILEEIVGNILDEYDEEEHDIIRLGQDDCYLMRGLARLDEIAELLEIEFPDEDIDTLNGFLLYELGRLPQDEEEINIVYQGYSFRPIDIHDKMIVQVKVSKAVESEEAS
ncbi:MAG: hemolysin family protein [Bacteroides sp.]|nr:hemolysin family protein [Bacteroides sp.]MCM1548659.1 hemolysin family protein [Clostridium sp.]